MFRRPLLVIVSVLALSACWGQSGFDAGRSGTSPYGTVTTANVGSLTHAFTDTQPTFSTFHAAVSGGKIFAVGRRLSAFDAGGCSGTAPASCPPIWQTADTDGFGSDVVVGGGRVWVTWQPGDTGVVRGYDPGGATCPTPTTCAPAITITTPHAQPTALRWINDTLHVTDQVDDPSDPNQPAHQYHYAYSADGTLRWQADLGISSAGYLGTRTPIADGDTVFLAVPDGATRAYDNRGITGCSGTPKTCAPMWSYPSYSQPEGARAGRLYATILSGGLGAVAAFDAKGVDGCSGAPKVCAPLWSTPPGTGYRVVDDTHLFGQVTGGLVAAFALDGTGCSGSPVVCQPQWKYVPAATGTAGTTGGSEAGGVLYSIESVCGSGGCAFDNHWYLEAHDAAGSVGCSGTPKVCHSLFSVVIPFRPAEYMIVGDAVYVSGEEGPNFGAQPAPVWGFRTS